LTFLPPNARSPWQSQGRGRCWGKTAALAAWFILFVCTFVQLAQAQTDGGSPRDGDSIVEEQHTTGHTAYRVFEDDGYSPILVAENDNAWKMAACDAAATPFSYVDRAGTQTDLELSTWGKVVRRTGNAGPLRYCPSKAPEGNGGDSGDGDDADGAHAREHRRGQHAIYVE
jgi:hypothetical protein